jgi:haloalkane dehalogenase
VNPAAERRASLRALLDALGDEYPFRSHWLELEQGAYHYVDVGPRVAETVLFVHGNPTWSFLWRHALRALRARWRVIAIDHMGCGLSDQPAAFGYRLVDHQRNLAQFIERLDLHRINLVVHDWGGPIGLGVAARAPERFARIVAMNTAAFPGGRLPWRIAVCRWPMLGPLFVRGGNGFARAAQLMALRERRRIGPMARIGYLAPYGSWTERVAIQRFVEDIPRSPAHPSWNDLCDVERGLERLAHLPWLLLWGERDWCFTGAFRREFERRLPRAQSRSCAQAGHWVMEDAREEVIQALAEFFRS